LDKDTGLRGSSFVAWDLQGSKAGLAEVSGAKQLGALVWGRSAKLELGMGRMAVSMPDSELGIALLR
jgi:hypothetical protein